MKEPVRILSDLHLGHRVSRITRVESHRPGRLPESGKDGSCPMLEQATGRCMIYENRPLGCRTHFCQAAGGPYARRDVVDLVHRLEDLSRALGDDEARPLRQAVEAAMRDAAPRGVPSKPYRRY